MGTIAQCCYIRISIGALAISLCAGGTAIGQAIDKQRLLIEKLAAHERLLSDFECSLSGTYEHLVERHDPGPGKGRPVRKYSERYEIVKQDGMLSSRFRRQSEVGDDRQLLAQERLRKFDGTTSRAVSRQQVNLQEGLAVDRGNFYPHMLFLHDYEYTVPLSVYLSGRDSIQAFPGSNWDASKQVEFSIVGEESIDGLRCVIVQADEVRGSERKPVVGCRLWICTDRSYIPIRFEAFTYRWSETVPVGRGKVLEFGEVHDGLWYPARWSKTAFDKRKIQSDGIEEPIWSKTYAVTGFKVDPDFPVSFFSDLPIPEGATVFRIDEGGDITAKFKK
ncbi:hypothetical protein FF011L_38830 [Roseimaritima multifibrata]|uniref:Outer membrane lipoprotein-sorting protein n=1 Tax=Roseimaritima multifibrata TaxID=1930274 RepID=A0A517MJN6_9BACT|nr:hypothetical protein [Roseimaritima multifibrata]QDS95099.1 hypothetical protein FF011L_38830 [Roseimaritima multifibrata]